jgi:drug/metabolite transporter (DMT)-like permease
VSLVVILAAGRNPLRAVRDAGMRQILAGLLFGALFSLFVVALSRVSAAFVLMMQTTSPLYAALLGRLFLGEPVSRDTIFAILAAGVGVVVMVGGNVGAGDTVGIVLSVTLPVVLGGYAVLIRSAPARDPGVPTLVGGTAAGVVAGLVAIAGPGIGAPAYDLWMAFLGGGLLIGLFTPIWNYVHRFVPPADVSLLLISEVVMAPLWVWIWMDEEPSGETLVGGAISLCAVTWLTLRVARSGGDALPGRVGRLRGLHVGAAPGVRRYRGRGDSSGS